MKNLNQDHDEKINDQINSRKNKRFFSSKNSFFFFIYLTFTGNGDALLLCMDVNIVSYES